MCGFVTPLQGPEADEHRKPEVTGGAVPTALDTHGASWVGGAALGEGWDVRDRVLVPHSPLIPIAPPPQAVVLEGNYWKRRIEVVMREYHKWRIYYKKRVSRSSRGPQSFPLRLPGHQKSPGVNPWDPIPVRPLGPSVKSQADSATVWPQYLIATCSPPRAGGAGTK